MDKIKTALKQTSLFCNFSDKELDKLLQTDGIEIQVFSRGQKIFPNEEISLCVLTQGQAESFHGQTLLRKFGYADIFGAASLFCQEQYPSVIIAKTKGQAIYISRAALQNIIEHNADFALQYIRFLSEKIYFLNQKINSFTIENACKKTAKYLYECTFSEFVLPISLSRLASSLCLSRASLYRALETLQKQGLIERTQRHIRILDRKKLKNIM